MSFKIFTDTSANLPLDVVRKHGISVIPFYFLVGGKENICMDPSGFDGASYYGAMREGAEVTTSQITPQNYLDSFTPVLEEGKNILFVSMSSGISGSFASAETAARQLRERFPERIIRLVDTLGASLGEGLPALWAAKYRDEGMGIEEVAQAITDRCRRMCQIFTVDDLCYLQRSGRLSNAAAALGNMLNIKPLLKGDEEGQIVCISKVRGRAKAIARLAETYKEFVRDPESQVVGIAHADCKEHARKLAEKLRQIAPPKDIMVVDYEPVTGSHVGPGALALFFESREGVRSM